MSGVGLGANGSYWRNPTVNTAEGRADGPLIATGSSGMASNIDRIYRIFRDFTDWTDPASSDVVVRQVLPSRHLLCFTTVRQGLSAMVHSLVRGRRAAALLTEVVETRTLELPPNRCRVARSHSLR